MDKKAIAHQKYIRISPRKMNQIMKEVRGKGVEEAGKIIAFTNKKACTFLGKLLKSAVANAVNNHGMDADRLYIHEVFSNPGPILKRISPQPMGRAFRINKRTCHNTIVLMEKEVKEVKKLVDTKKTTAKKEKVMEAGAEKKAAPKTAAKKTTAKKTTAKKTTAKKTTAKAKKEEN